MILALRKMVRNKEIEESLKRIGDWEFRAYDRLCGRLCGYAEVMIWLIVRLVLTMS